jgi:glycosyltransferase involved in cell wall biosynthesis
LESALAQTWPQIEVIVVDDGSTDDSLAIARSYARQNLTVHAQPNRGAAAARNLGLSRAQGDFVQFLDSDDLLAPDKIAVQLARLVSAPAGSVASGEWARFTTAPTAAVFAAEPAWRDMSGLDFLCFHYREGWMMPPIAWLAPRALLAEIGPWREDITLNDDGEYFCRVLLRSAGIVFCPGARCYYRSGVAGSLSRRKDAAALQSLVRSIEANAAALLAHQDSPRVRAVVADAWQRLAYDIYPTLSSDAKAAEERARSLGGSRLQLQGGRLVRWSDRLFGWRVAKQLDRIRSPR